MHPERGWGGVPAIKTDFRVRVDGPLARFTRDHPRAALALWCNWKHEVVEIAGVTHDAARALQEEVQKVSPWTELYPLGDQLHMLVLECVDLPHDFVNSAVDGARCLNLPPTRFAEGHEHYSIVSFSDARTRDLFKRLRESGREVELLKKRELAVQPMLNAGGMGVNAVLSELTEKQAESVLLAHRHGMYDSPRRVTAAQIAESVGLSRSTYEEHLRKAENMLMRNLVPHLELHLRARRSQAATPDAR